MRLARVRYRGTVHLARIEGEQVALLHRESDHPGRDALREALHLGTDLAGAGEVVARDDVQLLAPVHNPSKVIGVGLNYADHAAEAGMVVPEQPVIFVKTANSIIGPGDPIVVDPRTSTAVDFEAELAVVIGTRARRVTPEQATDHVLGFTICNDVSARDEQLRDGQWSRAKSFDGFAPIGPWIVAGELDTSNLGIETWVSGELFQSGSTSSMVTTPSQVVSYLSQTMTLEPGDIIATGTPAGVGFAHDPPRYLTAGDRVIIRIEGIGELTNPVVEPTEA